MLFGQRISVERTVLLLGRSVDVRAKMRKQESRELSLLNDDDLEDARL